MDECIQIGLGEELAEALETFLPAAHAGEPIMYDSDFHGDNLTID
jgi:hypothetical protein